MPDVEISCKPTNDAKESKKHNSSFKIESNDNSVIKETLDPNVDNTASPTLPRRRGRPPKKLMQPHHVIDNEVSFFKRTFFSF